MFRSICKYTPLLKRVFAFVICFIFLFFFASRPVVVSASTGETFVNVATNYQDVMQVAPVLIPIILILIGLDWYYSNIDEIVNKADELYFKGSAAFQAWAENAAQQMMNGYSTFTVSSAAANEINSKLGNYVVTLETGSVLVLPADLLSLRTLNPSDVLITSVAGTLGTLEGVSVENNKLLNEIKSYLTTAFTNLITWQRTLNNTLTQRLADIRTELYHINSSFTDRLADIRTELYHINSTFTDRLSDIRTMQSTINQTLTDRLTTLHDSFRNLKEHMDTRLLDIREMQTTINKNLTDRLSDMRTMMTTINSNLTDRLSKLHDSLRVLKTDVLSKLDDIYEMQTLYLGDVAGQVSALEATISDIVAAGIEDIRQMQTAINQNLTDRLSDMRSMMTTINQNLTDRLSSIRTMMTTINTNITNRLSDIQTRVKSLGTTVAGLPEAIGEVIGNDLTKINTSLEVISAKLDELLKTGTDVTTKPQIEVVAGTQTIVVTNYATMSQAFSAKMGWVPQIFDFLAELRSRLNSGTPPKIPIRLSAAEGSINWGEDAYILDMSWYARYKPSVDTILSGIMWLCCGWAIYKRIPDILSGVGLTVENATQDPGHVWTSRAERAERRARYQKGG